MPFRSFVAEVVVLVVQTVAVAVAVVQTVAALQIVIVVQIVAVHVAVMVVVVQAVLLDEVLVYPCWIIVASGPDAHRSRIP